MTQDRVGSKILYITHDFLATMLGTNRSGVSLAAGVLQRERSIEYNHGAVTIMNRKKLEDFACECYATMQRYRSIRQGTISYMLCSAGRRTLESGRKAALRLLCARARIFRKPAGCVPLCL